MLDRHDREISYLRLSVTDLCNLRCQYCMPDEGVWKLDHADILSVEEIEEIVRAAVACGICKVRVTGGEPLVRRGVLEICRRIAAIEGVGELCITTNGVLLPKYAKELRLAGVNRLNVSLDTLRPTVYRSITRVGTLQNVLDGLKVAKEAGFRHIKLNCVLIGGVNDNEIADFVDLTEREDYEVRFIELMPIGECAGWNQRRFIPAERVLEAVPALEPTAMSGVARLYRVPGWKGAVGLIRPMSACFCPMCNRIRITADGRLKPCLHSNQEILLQGLHGAALQEAIANAILEKPEQHHLEHGSESRRTMNRIGG